MNNLKYQQRLYFVILALNTIAYSLPHAILTVLLLSKGITLPQIMLIQIAYSCAMLLLEFPSGVVADLYSKKTVFLLSRIPIVAMFLLVCFSNNFYLLLLAWFLYGTSAALNTGTLDALLINRTKKEGDNLSKFISFNKQISLLSLVIGSFIGAFLFELIDIYIYLLSVVLVIVASVITYAMIDDDNEPKSNTKTFTHIQQSLEELTNNIFLQYALCYGLINSFFLQTHFQLWQAFLLERQVDIAMFPYFYLLLQAISLLALNISLSTVKHKYPFLLIGLLPFLMANSLDYVSLTAYLAYVFAFMFFEFFCDYHFNQNTSYHRISALTSLKSVAERLSAIIALLLINLNLTFFSVQTVLIVHFALAFVAIVVLWYLFEKSQKR
jgi:MFS family permease